eukprot:g1985.t1
MATLGGEKREASTRTVVEGGPLQISEQDDRKYRHVTLPNKMQVLLISDPDTDKEAAAMDVRVGYTSDPRYVQGIAHFCEHMLFLGTGKYPREDTYNAFLNSHGGKSNAFTSDEDTNYFFDVNAGHLDEALDVFSRFFVDPLFTEGATGRELKAIYSEHSKNLQTDSRRLYQVENTNAPVPSFDGTVPFGPAQVKRRVNVVPVKDTKTIHIFWPMPPLNGHFRSKPASYISHLVGHEGPGSLLSLLKCKGWANYLSAYPYMSASDWSMFAVTIQRVTEEGLKHVNEIVTMAYQYLNMIRDCGVQGWIHEENQAIDAMNFRFASKGDPMRYVSRLASNMQKYPPEFTVAGPELRFDYEPSLVRDLLGRLVPSNMLLVVSARDFQGQTDKVEQWIGSDYACEALGEDLINSWEKCGRREELRLPKPNPYIATDFTLRPAAAAPTLTPARQPGTASPLHLGGGEAGGKAGAGARARAGAGVAAAHDALSPPSLIRDDASCRLWHKTDGQFRKPKLNVEIALFNPVQYESPESYVMATLLAYLLDEDLNEEMYMAREAGLSLTTSVSKGALGLSLEGYSHKMKALLERVVRRLASFADSMNEEKRESHADETATDEGAKSIGGASGGRGGFATFERVRQMLLESYKNVKFRTPYQHAMSATRSCLQAPDWSNDEKLEVIEGCGITFEAMLLFIPRMLRTLHVEILVHGNATAGEALQLASVVVDGLKARPLHRNLHLEERVVNLRGQDHLAGHEDTWDGRGTEEEKGTVGGPAASAALAPEYRRSLACPNPEETNSAVMVTFQVCLDGAKDRARLALFTHLLKDKFFNQLRTQAQLGYIVGSGESVHGGHVHSAYFLIQSDDHSPCYLDESIEQFLTGFRETLSSLTPEEFAMNVKAVVQNLLEKDKNLGEETRRHWDEISDRSYVFDRSERDADAVRQLSQGELLEFYGFYFSPEGLGRKKLSVWAHGNQFPVETTAATAGAAGTLVTSEGVRGAARGGSTVKDKDAINGEDAAVVDSGGSRGDGGRRGREVVMIEDYAEFKRSMPLLPLRKPSPVQLVVDLSQPNP